METYAEELTPDFSKPPRAKRTDPAILGKLPPHSMPAEQGILGCILLAPVESMEVCAGTLKSEAFYDLRHRSLFDQFTGMHERKLPIDLITVHQRLKDAQMIESVGGMDYVSGLMDSVPSASNIDYYIGIVRDKYHLRQCAQTIRDIQSSIDQQEAFTNVVDRIDREAIRLREMVVSKCESVDIADRLHELMKIYSQAESGVRIPSVPTGFECIDKSLGGFRGGELIAVGARPKEGKTTLAVNIANYASDHGYPTGIFSLEMTADELLQRMVAAKSSVSSKSAEDGMTTDEDKKRMVKAMADIKRAPIKIVDQFTITVDQISLQCRKWKKEFRIKLVVIDYLQLIDRPQGAKPVEALSEITRKLKNLAGDLGIPIIMVSQLSRKSADDNRPPLISDFRDSGSIEQDANLIFMLHQNPKNREETNIGFVGRRCAFTTDKLMFHRRYNRFENMPKEFADEP